MLEVADAAKEGTDLDNWDDDNWEAIEVGQKLVQAQKLWLG